IVDCAERPRRELLLGFPTWKAVLADKLAPGLTDRYLARRGYGSQLTNVPADPRREDNLWAPLPGDHGAHGSFEYESRAVSLQYTLFGRHRRFWTGLGVAATAFAL